MASLQFRSDDTPNTWSEAFGDGSDGDLTISTDTTDSTANTTCSGNLSSTTLTVGDSSGFVNGNLVLIHQSRNGGDGAGVWELNKINSGGGTTTWTMKYALTNAYGTTAQVYLLKQYSGVTINSGITLTSSAWDGTKGGIVAYLCKGTITVTGTITTGGPGQSGGYATTATGYRGNLAVSSQNGVQGEGTSGSGGTVSTSANGSGGGGGGAQTSPDWDGGGGGNGTAGGLGGTGSGGGTSGNAGLTTMTFGGAGGAAGASTADGGHAGYGGGIILLIGITITVTGAITAEGTDGQVEGSFNGGGGGGAGGSVLFKGTNITLGTTLVKARGGVAGTGSGGTGGDGRIHADYQNSISGTTNPTLDSRQDSSLSTTTSTSTTSTSSSTSTTTTTSTSTTVSVTTSTSTTSTSSSTSTTTTSTSTTSTSTSTTSTSTSTTSTSTTLDLKFTVEQV